MFELLDVLLYFVLMDSWRLAEEIFSKIVAEGNVASEPLSFFGQVDFLLIVHLNQIVSLPTLQSRMYHRYAALGTLCQGDCFEALSSTSQLI